MWRGPDDPGDKPVTTAAAMNTASLVESYARGTTEVPLIEHTNGAFCADNVAR